MRIKPPKNRTTTNSATRQSVSEKIEEKRATRDSSSSDGLSPIEYKHHFPAKQLTNRRFESKIRNKSLETGQQVPIILLITMSMILMNLNRKLALCHLQPRASSDVLGAADEDAALDALALGSNHSVRVVAPTEGAHGAHSQSTHSTGASEASGASYETRERREPRELRPVGVVFDDEPDESESDGRPDNSDDDYEQEHDDDYLDDNEDYDDARPPLAGDSELEEEPKPEEEEEEEEDEPNEAHANDALGPPMGVASRQSSGSPNRAFDDFDDYEALNLGSFYANQPAQRRQDAGGGGGGGGGNDTYNNKKGAIVGQRMGQPTTTTTWRQSNQAPESLDEKQERRTRKKKRRRKRNEKKKQKQKQKQRQKTSSCSSSS